MRGQDNLNSVVLEALFSMMPADHRAVLCSVRGDPSTADGYAWGGTPWARGAPCSLDPGWNNYVAISSFRVSDDGRYRRRKDQFGAVHAIMVDDVGTKLPLSALPNGASLAPSMVVETSPENYQVTYFLAKPVFDQEWAEDVIKQMILKMAPDGVDPGMAGVTRVLRLPDGINGKRKYATDGVPWTTRLAYWRPDIRSDWLHLCDSFGAVRRQRVMREPGDGVQVERQRGFNIVLQGLEQLRLTRRKQRGWVDVLCPWVGEHTDRADNGAAVAYPGASNGWFGGFKCHHGHCQDRTWSDLEDWVGYQIVRRGRATRGEFEGVDA